MKWADIQGSRWYHRMRKISDYRRGPFGQIITGILLVTAMYNVGALLIYGSSHPINRHRWRRMKNSGELPAEFLDKEKIVNEYRIDRIRNPQNPYGLELDRTIYKAP